LLYFFGFALYTRCRFSDGRLVQEKAFRIAERLDDARAKAFATAGLLFLATATRPFPLEEMRRLAAEALVVADLADDIYLIATVHTSIGWSYFTRGLMLEAHECAQRLRRIGRERRDARSIAIGSWISAWADVVCEDYAAALRHGEECITIATSQIDRLMGRVAMGAALVLTGRVAEGRDIIMRMRAEAEAHHWLYAFTATDGPLGVAKVLSGEVKAGLSWLHAFIRRGELASKREPGTRNTAELAGLALAEVYISMLEGGRRMPLRMLLKNLVPLVVARIRASREAERLLDSVIAVPSTTQTVCSALASSSTSGGCNWFASAQTSRARIWSAQERRRSRRKPRTLLRKSTPHWRRCDAAKITYCFPRARDYRRHFARGAVGPLVFPAHRAERPFS
jgi:hypothetical protein